MNGDPKAPQTAETAAATGERYTTEFLKRRVQQLEPAAGYEMWVAVWNNRGRGAVMIGAPTLDELADRWEQITSSDFERHRAQHVVTLAANRAKVMPW